MLLYKSSNKSSHLHCLQKKMACCEMFALFYTTFFTDFYYVFIIVVLCYIRSWNHNQSVVVVVVMDINNIGYMRHVNKYMIFFCWEGRKGNTKWTSILLCLKSVTYPAFLLKMKSLILVLVPITVYQQSSKNQIIIYSMPVGKIKLQDWTMMKETWHKK